VGDIPAAVEGETLDGGLILPRGMLVTVTDLAAQAGSRLDITGNTRRLLQSRPGAIGTGRN
jgi:hypothetical protein